MKSEARIWFPTGRAQQCCVSPFRFVLAYDLQFFYTTLVINERDSVFVYCLAVSLLRPLYLHVVAFHFGHISLQSGDISTHHFKTFNHHRNKKIQLCVQAFERHFPGLFHSRYCIISTCTAMSLKNLSKKALSGPEWVREKIRN